MESAEATHYTKLLGSMKLLDGTVQLRIIRGDVPWVPYRPPTHQWERCMKWTAVTSSEDMVCGFFIPSVKIQLDECRRDRDRTERDHHDQHAKEELEVQIHQMNMDAVQKSMALSQRIERADSVAENVKWLLNGSPLNDRAATLLRRGR